DGAGERAGRRSRAAVGLPGGAHRRRDQVLAGGRRRDRPVDRHHRLAADVGQDRLVVLTLGVHHTHTRPAVDDLDASDRAPTVVEHQAFRRAPDSIPRDLERARDVRGELRMLDEELEDVVPRDERLALHAGGDRGLIHDGGQPRANGDGKLRGQRGPETSGERRSGNRQKGGGDERSGEVVKPRHDPPIIARPLTAARALRTLGPLAPNATVGPPPRGRRSGMLLQYLYAVVEGLPLGWRPPPPVVGERAGGVTGGRGGGGPDGSLARVFVRPGLRPTAAGAGHRADRPRRRPPRWVKTAIADAGGGRLICPATLGGRHGEDCGV